jgi:hypothetical protein
LYFNHDNKSAKTTKAFALRLSLIVKNMDNFIVNIKVKIEVRKCKKKIDSVET